MDVFRPKQFQRRKLLVVLVISTPLLARFPHSELESQMEERQPRLPFHRRPRPAINYNTIDKFKELSQAIDEMEKQSAAAPSRRAETLPMQTSRPTRVSASAARSKISAAAREAPLHHRLRASDMSFTIEDSDDDDDDVVLQPSRPARRSRKRIIYDSEDMGEEIVVAKRKKTQDKPLEPRSVYPYTPPPSIAPSIVYAPSPSTPCPRGVVEPEAPRKNMSERVENDKQIFFITVSPLTTDSCVEDQLRALLRKYQASIILGMKDLEQSILDELDTSKVMTFEAFRSLKKLCSEEKVASLAQPESSLGAWIKCRQASYLFDLTGVPVVEEK